MLAQPLDVTTGEITLVCHQVVSMIELRLRLTQSLNLRVAGRSPR